MKLKKNPADGARLVGEILPGGRKFQLTQPLKVIVRGKRLVVPVGTVTDFASVPRLLWRILPPWGRYSLAAVVHDWLYQTGEYPREYADWVFKVLMEDMGVAWWKRQAMYWGVRAGGWVAWRRHRARDEHKQVTHGNG